MAFLCGAVAFSALFTQSYKFALARKYDVDWVSVSAFGFSALFLALSGRLDGGHPAWVPALLGGAYGVAGGGAQVTFFRALRHGTLSISWTIVSMSLVVPVLASIVIWQEQPTPWQVAAVVAVVAAVALMGDVEWHQVARPRAWAGWMALAFLASGAAGVIMQLAQKTIPDGSAGLFLLAGYLVSVAFGVSLVKGRRPHRRDLMTGGVRGFAVLAANTLVLRAISVLPGYLVFAAYGAAGIVINLVASTLIWGERLKGRSLAGALLAVGAIVVLNL